MYATKNGASQHKPLSLSRLDACTVDSETQPDRLRADAIVKELTTVNHLERLT
jgi:hypothetical protein